MKYQECSKRAFIIFHWNEKKILINLLKKVKNENVATNLIYHSLIFELISGMKIWEENDKKLFWISHLFILQTWKFKKNGAGKLKKYMYYNEFIISFFNFRNCHIQDQFFSLLATNFVNDFPIMEWKVIARK